MHVAAPTIFQNDNGLEAVIENVCFNFLLNNNCACARSKTQMSSLIGSCFGMGKGNKCIKQIIGTH